MIVETKIFAIGGIRKINDPEPGLRGTLALPENSQN
jgi:hypothetical protein